MIRKIAVAVAVLLLIGAVVFVATLPTGPNPSTFANLNEQYDVRILRDTWGVPHIYGKTDADCAFGLAYAHAEDDFPTIREALLSARGELASQAGAAQAPIDYMVKLLRIRETVDAQYESLPEDVRGICEAYADGANYYISQHPDELAKRYLPLTPQDIIAGFTFKGPFFFGLDNQVQALFGDSRRYPVSEKQTPQTDTAYVFDDFFHKRGIEVGSNTFAVAPSRTSDGSTYLNINSHQPWDGPVAWYEAHVKSEEGWNCTGGLFPGSPIILVGHNENLGWAHTVNKPDLIDIFVLDINPDNPDQYKLDGEWHDLEVTQVPIEVKIWGPIRWTVKQEALWSEFGPVVRRDHGAYAIRYSGMGDIRQIEQWYRMNKAANFDEWQSAMKMRANASLNSGYADKEGNIYYLYNGKIPVRAEGYNWKQYLPGDSSDLLWEEFIPFEAMPQLKNPESGFIINCNNTPYNTTTGPGNPKEEDVPEWAGIETHMTNRAVRALELFSADDSITWEEFAQYKFDDAYSEQSDEAKIWRHLCKAESDNPEVNEALEVLRKWDLHSNIENTSAALALLTIRPGPDDDPRTLDEEATQKLLDELNWAANVLKEKHGRINVPWGEVNRMVRGDVNVPIDGAPDVLRAVYSIFKRDGSLVGFDEGQLKGRGGDGYFALVRWDADGKVSSEVIHQYGSAITRPDSDYYDNQAEMFARKEMRPSLFWEEDLQANLSREYRPGEE